MNYKHVIFILIGIIAPILSGLVGTTPFVSAQNTEMPTIIDEAKWHPHGESLLVTGRGAPGVWGLWLFDTNLQLVQMLPSETPVSADWCPDGARLSMGYDILDAQTLEVLLTLDTESGISGWSPDGIQVLAWVDEQGMLSNER